MPADWTTRSWVTVYGRRSASSRRFTTAIDCRGRKNWSGSGRGPRRYAAACRRSRWTDAMNSPSRSPRTLVGMTALALAAALGLALVVVTLARGSANAHALESGYGSSTGFERQRHRSACGAAAEPGPRGPHGLAVDRGAGRL